MGGSFTAKDLARALSAIGMRYNMDSIDFKRFRKNEQGLSEPRIYKNPSASPLKDRHILIVEDVVDEAITLKFAKNSLGFGSQLLLKSLPLAGKKNSRPIFKLTIAALFCPMNGCLAKAWTTIKKSADVWVSGAK